MTDLFNKTDREKHQFKSYYCAGCKQVKPCQLLTGWDSGWKSYCCPCYYQSKQEKAQEYSSYQQVYQQKTKEKKAHYKQLLLLKNYQGCNACKSQEIDAYSLYEENKLVCQPCLMKKTGEASSPISFLEQEKWHRKFWKINLTEWLENFSQLPVNTECAREWLKDKEHLKKCECLEVEARKLYELFANSLRKSKEKLKNCRCEISEKVRVDSDYYAWCERCEESISVASKKRVIKNRNDPRFWGLEVKEKVLCGDCLEKRKEGMSPLRKAEFNRYRKLKRL
jgi:hypothetical protein